MGFLRDFVSQCDLTGPVALQTWYGEYQPWRRVGFYIFLYVAATGMRTLAKDKKLNETIPLVSPFLDDSALKDIKRKHSSCMEALCADAKAMVVTCNVQSKEDGTRAMRSFNLEEYRRNRMPTVLHPPVKCTDAVEASFGGGLSQKLPPLFSLDPKIPALLNMDHSCSVYVDSRMVGLNTTQYGEPIHAKQLSSFLGHSESQTSFAVSPANMVCTDLWPTELQREVPLSLETYNWLLSPMGRSLVRNVSFAVIVGINMVTTFTETIWMAFVYTACLSPLAFTLQRMSPEPLRFGDTLVSLLLLLFLTFHFNPFQTEDAMADLLVRHMMLMFCAFWLKLYRLAFEWWFLMMFQCAWEGGIPIIDHCLLLINRLPLVGTIASPFINGLMNRQLRKLVVPFGCAIYRSFPRQRNPTKSTRDGNFLNARPRESETTGIDKQAD